MTKVEQQGRTKNGHEREEIPIMERKFLTSFTKGSSKLLVGSSFCKKIQRALLALQKKRPCGTIRNINDTTSKLGWC